MQNTTKSTPVTPLSTKSGELSGAPVAVFDSGIGGICVLRELHRILPCEDLVYFGDGQNAPYGEKPPAEVRALILQHAARLLERAKALVLACNTATALAVSELRRRYPDRLIVGMEPALKPAALVGEHPRVLLLATQTTLQQPKLAALLEKYQKNATVMPLPAPRIVDLVEKGEVNSPALAAYLAELLSAYVAPPPDALVLGCTHFVFARRAILQTLGREIPVFDGVGGTAAELARRLTALGLQNSTPHRGTVTFTSSKPGALPLYSKMFFEN